MFNSHLLSTDENKSIKLKISRVIDNKNKKAVSTMNTKIFMMAHYINFWFQADKVTVKMIRDDLDDRDIDVDYKISADGYTDEEIQEAIDYAKECLCYEE